MLTYQTIEGAKASKNAQTFTPSSEGLAMAHIPGWELLFDPNNTNGSKIQNRCIRNTFCDLVSGSINLGQFTNGEKAFLATDALPIRINPNLDFPVDAWSLVFVAKPTSKSTTDINSIVASNTYTKDAVKVGVAFSSSTNRLRIMKSGALSDLETRLTYTPSSGALLSESENVFIVTGSTKDGLSIYRNGILVASNIDKDLIANEWKAGEWGILRGARGLFGMIGLLSIDLNDSENSMFRNQINSFLMEKYNIK